MTYQNQIRAFVEARVQEDGLIETGIDGVKLFRATRPVPCAPVVYEPSIIAIASGAKEVVMEGARCVYDSRQYLCCPMSMPVQAGTQSGVYITLKA